MGHFPKDRLCMDAEWSALANIHHRFNLAAQPKVHIVFIFKEGRKEGRKEERMKK